ncbi:class IV lanthionine synthetase LanL [Actinomadura sp. ATCC 31491]|uniref:Class IV lanthionine synthetase LanL n=1 Tax=Actinomadura luzonensis TaxID=2805427 RepID=A0ABT0FP85_9ACTN|nr:class IV lanthionine synthetase LanL [Actinomadura luzonensis]MCK2213718.1 class IV lanthionine synthetase LanL [Actinomadura luzonensis]
MLEDVARAALRRSGGDREWRFRTDPPWTYAAPDGAATRPQGWKLHVAATPLSAPVVLARVARVLGRRGCPFKYAADLEELARLVARDQDRGSVGKFVTVYPPTDAEAAEIAEELHEATRGLPGAPILSDRVYRPGSLVHYRFGVFSAPSELDNDGSYASRLTAPDGTRVPDERNAWYSPPDWAECPFESGREPARTAPPQAVLLAGRFVVREAIRHGAKGGVFLAEDRESGRTVVIKQARPHLGAGLDGTDERDRLRHEARMLDVFGPLDVTARKVLLFEQDGNVFLAQEHIEGGALAGWEPDAGDRAGDLLGALRGLAELVGVVHEQGHVLRDLTPNNVIMTGDGGCRLIDLEMAAVPGTVVGRAFTPGYAAPEQVNAPTYAPAPGVAADLYAFGAIVLFAATGCQPPHLKDRPAGARSWDERVETTVRVAVSGDPLATALSPLMLGLLRERPDQRWDLPRVRDFLAALDPAAPGPAARHRLETADQDRLLHDGLAFTLRTMTPGTAERPSARLWPSTGFGLTADPCAVQYGSAGVIALWTALLDGDALAQDVRPALTDALREAAGWTARRLERERRPSPGLYFGRAGIAVALHDAGRLLDDEGLRSTGVELGLGLPVGWPNPDICHGAAGTGLALLHLWRATGDARFRDLADACADGLLKAARRTDEGGVSWPVPAGFDSKLAGADHYGFAHGVAGVAAYLLAAGTALGRGDCVETAVTAGETLLRAAERHGEGVWWAEGPSGGSKLPHWCNGSSGVGTFLVRLYAATGDRRFREAAHGAAMAVRDTRHASGTAACHGLAGDGQFLLDMAALLDEPAYHELAEDLAASLWARAVLRDGLLVVPDELGGEHVSVAWNTGLAGPLDFLHRLRHGGPRRWMAEQAGQA